MSAMKRHLFASLIAAVSMSAAPVLGQSAGETAAAGTVSLSVIQLMSLQCVPYARSVSGIQIYGDAHTWWGQAAGKYARGSSPRVGAVMAFKPYGRMELGHVAAVSRIVDSRTVLLRHANWSPINGARGQIENDVRAIDVSPNNDWSKVRVWFAPLQGLGGTAWPVQGFIYTKKPGKSDKLFERGTKPKPSLLDAVTAPTKATRAPAETVGYSGDPIGAIIAESLKSRRR